MYKNLQQCQNTLDGIQAIDFYLARQLCQVLLDKFHQHDDEVHSLLFHSIMATSQALRDGHSCLKLSEISGSLYGHNPDENKEGYQFPELADWQNCLSRIAIGPENEQPLVYDQGRLYLRRYWQFEQQLAIMVQQLMANTFTIDPRQGQHIINQLFPDEPNSGRLDWQKIAVANALGRQFSIITGGPGTGKTFTVTKLLAALQALSNNRLQIAMVAPTGKAAQRLNESIQKAKAFLSSGQMVANDTIASIPDTASTLHRLLGVQVGSHNFRFNEARTLPVDVIVVDEISMIDLPLMTRLLRALNSECRIILLGDADQLPSVAAGSVLADLAPDKPPCYSAANSQWLGELTGYDIPACDPGYDHLTVLQQSRRFEGGGEIARLAAQIINGNARSGWQLLTQGQQQIALAADNSFNQWLQDLADEYFVPLFSRKNDSDLTINQAFVQLNQFRFLAAIRQGEQGVRQINTHIEHYLRQRGFISSRNDLYPGRPIMVTENHYHIGLYNGDTGLLWLNDQGILQAAFPQGNPGNDQETGHIRWLSLGRLPNVETVYAMTIHKTQGSEFSHVALVLPLQDSPILSRELLYTAVTRASRQLTVRAEQEVFELAVNRKIQRFSGLQSRVFGE